MGGIPKRIEGYTLIGGRPGYAIFDLPSTTRLATRDHDHLRVIITILDAGVSSDVWHRMDELIGQLGVDAHSSSDLLFLPAIVDRGANGGRRWIATRALDGGTLDERMPLAPIELARLGSQLVGSVDRLHKRGLTQGSISPGSIRFDDLDQPVLCLTKLDDAEGHRPPEDDFLNSAHQRDVYAVASILHRAVAGPWSEGERAQLTTMGVAPEIAGAIHSILVPNPADRPVLVIPAVAVAPAIAVPPEIAVPITRPAGARRWKATMAFGVVAVLAMIGTFIVTSGNDPTRVESSQVERSTTTLFGSTAPFDPVTFEPQPLTNGAVLLRTWTISDDGSNFTSLSVLSNSTKAPIETFHVESIPKELAADVSVVTFDPAPSEVLEADPVVMWLADIGPGQRVAVQSRVPLLKRPSMADLESWKAATLAVEETIRADQQQSFCARTLCTTFVAEPTSVAPTTDITTPRVSPDVASASTTSSLPGLTTPRLANRKNMATTPPISGSTSPTATTTVPAKTTVEVPPTTAAPQAPDAPRSVLVRDPQGFNDCDPSPNVIVNLSWQEPASSGGRPVTKYVIRASRAATSSTPAWSTDQNGLSSARESLVNIPASDSDAPVLFEIRAQNAVGVSATTIARVVVPSMIGQCAVTATRALRSLGLSVDRTSLPSDTGPVAVQSPGAAGVVVAGSTIRLS